MIEMVGECQLFRGDRSLLWGQAGARIGVWSNVAKFLPELLPT
jgi:hypothetical protein